jgi:hypothetical protein
MAKIKKAQTGRKLTPARTRQVADSLDYEAYMKNAAGVKSVMDSPKSDKAYKLAKALYSDADVNTANAKRYRKLADKAEGKKQKSGGSTPAWQRKEGKNPEGGLNAKGVASYRRANPGSKLKTAVTTKPSKLKAGSKAASRRKSFCSRMSGMKKKLTSAKTANDPNSRINKSLRKWNC